MEISTVKTKILTFQDPIRSKLCICNKVIE